MSLRAIALTPERIPTFIIPPSFRSPLPFRSPRAFWDSPDRTRLLSEDHNSPGSSDTSPEYRQRSTHLAPSTTRPSRFLRLSSPGPVLRLRLHRSVAKADHQVTAESDTDLSTRAAMSLPHVERVTTPYGFRAVLAASPCTSRRESLFHKSPAAATVTVKITGADYDNGVGLGHELRQSSVSDSKHGNQGRSGLASGDDESKLDDAPPTTPGSSRMGLRPVRALGLQLMKELDKPVAALKALTPGRRKRGFKNMEL